jgi:hypothetical protein
MVVVGKDNEPIIFMKAPEALMMAAELLKHAAIVTSGATMVADAIERAQEDNGDGKVTPMPSRLGACEVPPPDAEKEAKPETPPEQET